MRHFGIPQKQLVLMPDLSQSGRFCSRLCFETLRWRLPSLPSQAVCDFAPPRPRLDSHVPVRINSSADDLRRPGSYVFEKVSTVLNRSHTFSFLLTPDRIVPWGALSHMKRRMRDDRLPTLPSGSSPGVSFEDDRAFLPGH